MKRHQRIKTQKLSCNILEELLKSSGIPGETCDVKPIIARIFTSKIRWIIIWDWPKPLRTVFPVP